jgi:hypothetical protein
MSPWLLPLERFTEGSPMVIDEKNEKVNPYLVPRCSITPASSSSPLFGRG